MECELLLCDTGTGYTVRWAHNKRALKKFRETEYREDNGSMSNDPFAGMQVGRTKEDCRRLAIKYICHIKKVLALAEAPVAQETRKIYHRDIDSQVVRQG